MSTSYGLHRSLLLNRNGRAISFENRSRTWGELGDRVGALRSLPNSLTAAIEPPPSPIKVTDTVGM